ncbi:hypothetical protein WJX74_007793 [Apatococcus lobatus]|uniref:Glycosyltransferase n=1 Tax=Apatococcus lobatus TaxID=904363 RepID=A0AAW1SC54_9CHLO
MSRPPDFRSSVYKRPTRSFSPDAARVAVVNPYLWSYPTIAAIAEAVRASGIRPEVFQQDDTSIKSRDKFTPHVSDMYRFICKETIQSLQTFVPELYTIIILGDWYPTGCLHKPNDVTCSHHILRLLDAGSLQRLIIHMHEPASSIGSLHEARWDTDVELVKSIKADTVKVLQDPRITLLTAAPHVANYTQVTLGLMGITKDVGWFLQLIPWNNQAVLRRERHGFIVQRPGLLEHPGFTLRLVGSAANADVDFVLAGKIWAVTDRSSFKDYWRELQSSLAIVPAFSNSRYLDSAASSTLFTSVLLGIPIIADDDILKTYSYLTKDDVLYQSSLETVYDVMARYVHASMHDDIIRISRNLIRLRNTQLRRNKVVFQRLIM